MAPATNTTSTMSPRGNVKQSLNGCSQMLSRLDTT
jgi:hypothetical protein